MRRFRRVAVVLWAALGVALATGVASAHRLQAAEFAVPVPLPVLYAGAGVTVAATAVWLARGDVDRVPLATRSVVQAPPRAARSVRLLARALVLAAFAVALAHGLVGPPTPAENLATVVLWPLGLKGLAVVAVLAGSFWRAVSPWETLYDLLVGLEGTEIAVLGDYPDWLGSWPALVGFVVGVGVLENLTLVTRSPTGTVAVAGGYAAVMLVGGVAFGRAWFARADALAVLFDLLGRVSVFDVERDRDGARTVVVRPPWRGCLDPVRDASVAAFVVATVYTVSFDGFTATATFRGLRDAAVDAVGLGVAGLSLYLTGLALFFASYAVAARSATAASRSGDGASVGTTEAGRAFAGSVVPIAAAYEVAHNYPFVLANLGRAVALGRELALGVGDPISLLGWLPVAAFWVSQVALIVVGHLVGVVAAHGTAIRVTGSPAAARRTHAPFVVVMVAYTVVSLWVVSQPLAA